MKTRNGFVSNSSSCSFLCAVCSGSEAGHDSIGPEEYGFCYCENGHELCIECLIGPFVTQEEPHPTDFKTTEEYNKEMDKWESFYGYYGDSTQLATNCPICQFIEVSKGDMVVYLLKEFKVPKKEVLDVIKEANRRRRKLYDNEYITYVCQKEKFNLADLLPKIKERFDSYVEFKKYLNE